MTSAIDDPQAVLRRSVYLLLMTLGTGVMLGRILAVDSVDKAGVQEYRIGQVLKEKSKKLVEQGLQGTALDEALDWEAERLRGVIQLRRPMLSANDRSRWCTVRALVEEQLRVDGSPYSIDKVIEQPGWDTIDMVKHDGHLYSSKPPLLATLIAGVYWVVYHTTGATLGSHPYPIVRFMLVLLNIVPLVVSFLLLARLVERFGTTSWGRLFVIAAAVFGTFLTTFAVTLNNHLPAAVCATIALYAAVPIWCDGQRHWRNFLLAGFFGALMVANELPSAALFAILSLAMLWKAPWRTLLAYLPAAIVVVAGFFSTNWIAHGTLRPAYAYRGAGGDAADTGAENTESWYDFTYLRNGREYESYWRHPVGVDQGEPSPAVYALHVLVGHHGIFSLTPIWLLSVAGAAIWLFGRHDWRLRGLATATVLVSLVCLAFYLTQPLYNRNYGGMASGLRWMFWLAPLWLLMMLPAVDALAGRWWTRGTALVLLAASVLSASYPTWNPWSNPWLMDYLYYLGRI
jgi:hypothetical protein